jgi:hypothetical protein
METKNIREPWTENEDIQLNQLYNIDMLDIMEISKINNRPPGGIISRLCKNNYIPNRTSARGYMVYKNSDLYKQIVSNNKVKEKESKNSCSSSSSKESLKIYSVDNMLITINKREYIEMQNDINEIKNKLNMLIDMIT